MSIKKIITGLALSMLLGSEMAAADWGDVYYCQMTNFLGITLKGEKQNYTPEKFQFKLDQTKNAMVFGSTGYFKDVVLELGDNWLSQETWYANDKYSITYFAEGKFLYTYNNALGALAASADCDKF